MTLTRKIKFIAYTACSLLLFILGTSSFAGDAFADDCIVAACLSVYTEDGQIVIEGRKDATPPVVLVPQRRRSPRPTPLPFTSPSTTLAPTVRPLPRVTRVRPTVRVYPKSTPKAVVSISLNDRLIKLLPSASIAKQPIGGAVVGVPVIYWCDLPTIFTTRVSIIGEVIDVAMRPSFFWSFGDGSIQVTTQTGRPFPYESIFHTYDRAGNYPVVLMATWGGTWTHNGIAREITGVIRKTSVSVVTIKAASTSIRR